MIKYILGFFLNLFKSRVSIFARIDKFSKVGKHTAIYRRAQIFNSVIGDYSYVGVNTSVVYAEIGKFCSIGNDCICGLGVHSISNLSTSPIFREKKNALDVSWVKDSTVYPYDKLVIGNDVWIGTRSVIKGGIKVGNGAVIGAGSIVTKDVPPYAVVAGVPAKIIKYRFDDKIIDKLNTIKWWNVDENVLRDNISFFQDTINNDELEVFESKLSMNHR